MPKRKRNYPREEARRKELAEQRGYKSRGALRWAIEHGKAPAIRPERIKTADTWRAQANAGFLPPPKPTDIIDTNALRRRDPNYHGRLRKFETAQLDGLTPAQRAAKWSDENGRAHVGQYHPEDAKTFGLTRSQYTNAYLRAFVFDQNYKQYRHRGGSPEMRYWFVNIQKYFSADDYETRYGTDRSYVKA